MPEPSPKPKRNTPLAELLRGKLSEHVVKPAQEMARDVKKRLDTLYTRSYQKSNKVLTPADFRDIRRGLTPAQQVAKKFGRLMDLGK